jgi:hypothetical protein
MKNLYLNKLRDFFLDKPSLIFPAVLLIIFILLVSFRISGSSIGIYHEYLYGSTTKDSNLIYGEPQAIRSDEWLVNTQMAMAQEQVGYAYVNPNFNTGKNMSLIVDAPYLEWSALFKSQNFSFFILPLEYAFAFKWWFMLFALLLSSYYFFLRIVKDRVFIAFLMSIIVGFTPFMFWWYQSGTLMTLTYSFLILLVSLNIIDRKPIKFLKKTYGQWPSAIIKTFVLTYLLSSFALMVYPPFQIPIAIVIGFFLLGYLIDQRKKLKKHWKFILAPVIGSVVVTASICGAFIMTRSDVVSSINNTVYPGKRVVASGGYDIKKILTTYLQPQLQREGRGSHYGQNQSESSSFILMPLFFILPSIALLAWIYMKKKKVEWVLLALIACCLLFLTNLFIPGTDLLAKLSLLYLVPHDRLTIGLGFVTVILVAYMAYLASKHIPTISRKTTFMLLGYTFAFFAISIWAGFEVSRAFPDFINSKKLIVLLAIFLYVGLGLLLINRIRAGMILIALFSIASVIQIHPLYHGLGPIYNSEISKTIQQLSTKEDKWAIAQSIQIENLPQASGRQALTGVSAYPNTTYWEKYAGSENAQIYNRFAHTFLSSNDSGALVLINPDLYAISSSCERKVSQDIDYILSTTTLEGTCHRLVKTLHYPKATFFFYQVAH